MKRAIEVPQSIIAHAEGDRDDRRRSAVSHRRAPTRPAPATSLALRRSSHHPSSTVTPKSTTMTLRLCSRVLPKSGMCRKTWPSGVKLPQVAKSPTTTSDQVHHVVAVVALPAASREPRDEARTWRRARAPDVAGHLGQVVVGEVVRLARRAVAAEDVRHEQQRRPAHDQRSGPEEPVRRSTNAATEPMKVQPGSSCTSPIAIPQASPTASADHVGDATRATSSDPVRASQQQHRGTDDQGQAARSRRWRAAHRSENVSPHSRRSPRARRAATRRAQSTPRARRARPRARVDERATPSTVQGSRAKPCTTPRWTS